MGDGLTLVTTIITVVGTVLGTVLAALIAAYFQYGSRWRKKNDVSIPDESQQASTSEPDMTVTNKREEALPVPAMFNGHSKTDPEEAIGKVELITVGPWGYPREGGSFYHNGYDGIKIIRIWCGWVIDSIEVQYTKRGELVWTPKVGGGGGSANEIVLENGEYINEITGYYGRLFKNGRLFKMGTINSLTFFTNRNNKFGPYGLDSGTPLEEKEDEPTPFQVRGGKIVGFHGSSGPFYLSTIGFYVSPLI